MTEVSFCDEEQMITASITGIGGNAGIEFGSDDTPEDADVKADPFGDSLFD